MLDFSVVLRKENHKPSSRLPSMQEITSPAKSWAKEVDGALSNSRGSKSAIAGKKRYNPPSLSPLSLNTCTPKTQKPFPPVSTTTFLHHHLSHLCLLSGPKIDKTSTLFLPNARNSLSTKLLCVLQLVIPKLGFSATKNPSSSSLSWR
ncbi:hypothetical protein ACFX2J_017983 [Malus domestica]